MSRISEQAMATVQEMPERERPISEQFRIVAKQWVDQDAAASLLEDTKSAVFSQMVLKHTDVSVARAEHLSRSSKEYREHIEKTVDARRLANRLKVQMEYLKMRFHEWNSSDANQRTERKMSRQAT